MIKFTIFVLFLVAAAVALLLPEFIIAEPMEPARPRTLEEFEKQAVYYREWTPLGVCVERVGVVVPGEPDLDYQYWIYASWGKTFRQGDPRIQGDNIENLSVQYESQNGVMNFEPVKWTKWIEGSGNVSNVIVLIQSIDKTSYKVADYHKMVRGVAYYLDGNEYEYLGDVALPDPNTPIAVFTDPAMYDKHFWGNCRQANLPMVTYGYPSYP